MFINHLEDGAAMATTVSAKTPVKNSLPKTPTGVQGLDEITGGGLPQGRPTLVCGGAGCGKTLLGMEFLVRGATQFDEPGVFMAFEETAEELTQNVLSLGFDLESWCAQKKTHIDYVRVERSEIEETANTTWKGCSFAWAIAIDSVGAKRVVLDTIESLFAGLSNSAILRAELRRLFRWLKDKGVTAIITGERGERHAHPPRPGRIRLRLRDRAGPPRHRADFHAPAADRQVPRLHSRHQRISFPDRRRGHFRPADHLAGTASTRSPTSGFPPASPGWTRCSGARLLSRRQRAGLRHGRHGQDQRGGAHFVDAACRRGERCLYFAFEESQSQLVRNMRSIGIDL